MSTIRDVVAGTDYNATTISVFADTFESFQKILPYYDTTSFVLYGTYHPWILSVIGAIVVGLSGIVPFIIIPVDGVDSLKDGSSSQTLRMLLSFAVGGLLGDVFLHLLPEVWNNAHSFVSGRAHSNSTGGLWVLAGLLIFIIVEKMCSFDKDMGDGEETDAVVKRGAETEAAVDQDDDHRPCQKSSSATADQKSTNNNNTTARTAKQSSKRRRRRRSSAFLSNDLAVNFGAELKALKNLSTTIMNNNNVGDDNAAVSPLIKKSSNIHISGYLNLVANSIDNFTHGLAVGGGFLLSTRIGLLTTFAILVHEIPHEVGDFAILMRAGFSRCEAAWAQMYTASAGILGALTALTFSACSNEIEARTSWILPFTAGGFLHIALVTVLPELLNENNPKESFKQMCSLASGITVMRLLTMLIEG